MYKINTNQPHPSIQLGYTPDSLDHPFSPGGLADREDPSYLQHQAFVGQQAEHFKINSSKGKEARDDIVRGHDKWMIALLKHFHCPSSESSAGLFERFCYQFCHEWEKDTPRADLAIEVDYEWIKKVTCRNRSVIGNIYFNNFRQTHLFEIESYEQSHHHWRVIIRPGRLLLLILQNEQLCHNKKLQKMSANLRSALGKLSKMTPPKIGVIIEQDLTLLERDIIKFIFSRAWENKSVTKNKKVVEKIFVTEKKAVSRSEPSSARPEQSQERIALKATEEKEKTEPLSETPTKSPERKEVKKEIIQKEEIFQKVQQKTRERKDWKKEQPTSTSSIQTSNTQQASQNPQKERTEAELNEIAEEAYAEFLVLFTPEEDKRFKCFRSDFLRLVKVRAKSHLGCIEDIKTYMRKFSINQYLMGKRLGRDGKFFQTSLYSLFGPKIINDYHQGEYSRYFTPYNELDMSQQTEAIKDQDVTVPQELLQKISLALLEESDKNEADPEQGQSSEQTKKIVEIVLSHVTQKVTKQELMTQTPEKKYQELKPLPVLTSSSSEQATIRAVNQDKAWLKKGESYWQTLDISCRKQWEDEFMDAIRRGETGFRVDQDIHDPMFRKFKTVPFMTWIGKILEQEEMQEKGISPATEIEEIDYIIPELEEPEEVEFEDFPKEELEQSDPEGLWVTHFQNKPSSYGQSMKRTLHTLLLFASLWQSAEAVEIKSCFTPQQQCLPLIVHELQNAQSEILIQAYSLTSKPISKALRDAHDRGVKVKILVDPSQEKSPHSQVGLLKQYGLDVMVDDKVRIAHNKVIVIDGKTLIGGSYNFSAAAEKHNAENLIIIKDDPVVQEYRQNWWNRFGKSRVLKMLLRPRL